MWKDWKISNAFLQGLTFAELATKARSLGFEQKAVRRIFAKAPTNVWRHFRELRAQGLVVPAGLEARYVLEFIKPVYGLVDAPLLWQLGLLDYIRNTMKGTSSSMVDNFLFWREGNALVLLITIHVDDLLVVGLTSWMTWARQLLTKRFG